MRRISPVSYPLFSDERRKENTGAVQKVWPSENVLASRMEHWRDDDIEAEVRMAIAEIVGHDAIVTNMISASKDRYDVDQTEDWIRIGYARDVHDFWRAVVKAQVGRIGRSVRSELKAAVREEILSLLTERDAE